MQVKKHSPLFVLITLLMSTLAGATWADEPTQKKVSLTLEGSKKVMAAAVAEAHRLGAPGASIAIVDEGGHLILLERLDGTLPATPPVSIGKARTAAIFRNPTSKFENIIKDGRTPMLNIDGFTPMQGGIPIRLDGQVIGAIGVSGAASAPQDEEIAIAGAKAAETFK